MPSKIINKSQTTYSVGLDSVFQPTSVSKTVNSEKARQNLSNLQENHIKKELFCTLNIAILGRTHLSEQAI